MTDFGDMMKQAQKIQGRYRRLRRRLLRCRFRASGAGLVKVTMNGRHEVSRVEIDPSVLTEEKSMLEDLRRGL